MKDVVALIVMSIIPSISFAGKDDAAIKAATEAAYKQFGLEQTINHYVETRVNEDVRVVIEKTYPVVDVIVNKKVSVEWTF